MEESKNVQMINSIFSMYLNANVLKSTAISWHKQNMRYIHKMCYPEIQVANICDANYINHALLQQHLLLQSAEVPVQELESE